MYGKFWFDDDFFVRNMDASVELFFFFFFFYEGISSAFDFSMSIGFSVSKELRIVNLLSARRICQGHVVWTEVLTKSLLSHVVLLQNVCNFRLCLSVLPRRV